MSNWPQKPFPHQIYPDFLTEQEITELLNCQWETELIEKNNDLYQFKQTADIAFDPKFKNILENKLIKFNENELTKFCITNKKIKPQNSKNHSINFPSFSAFYAEYSTGNYLLPHDDKLTRRRFAYIIYLVDQKWDAKTSGGQLDLFDENCLNVKVSLTPKRGSLVVFEVCKDSWHQVREVFDQDLVRKSITGWFLGETEWIDSGKEEEEAIIKSKRPRLEQTWKNLSQHSSDSNDLNLINQLYLDINIQGQIQEKFLEQSEILLDDFLSENDFKSISKELAILFDKDFDFDDSIIRPGRPGKQYESISQTLLDDPNGLKSLFKNKSNGVKIDSLIKSFLNENGQILLSNWTGLVLHESSAETDEEKSNFKPLYQVNINKWQAGSYTMLKIPKEEEQKQNNDDDHEDKCVLDVYLHFNIQDDYSFEKHGGQISYMDLSEEPEEDEAEEEEENLDDSENEDQNKNEEQASSSTIKQHSDELMTIVPKNNCLSLIYREPDTKSFHKYLNYQCCKDKIFLIFRNFWVHYFMSY